MAATRAIAIKNLEKAQVSENRGKHGKWLKTLEKEEQRKRYLEQVAEDFGSVAEVQIKAALGKATKKQLAGEKDRKEIIHQFVGKPIERLEVAAVVLKIDV